eukprot:1158179-Pelagomonas_calceolata.AAC.1
MYQRRPTACLSEQVHRMKCTRRTLPRILPGLPSAHWPAFNEGMAYVHAAGRVHMLLLSPFRLRAQQQNLVCCCKRTANHNYIRGQQCKQRLARCSPALPQISTCP